MLRWAGSVFIPLGGPSIYAAWRAQYLRRLASPVFTPLIEPSVLAAWRTLPQKNRHPRGCLCAVW
ncbi:MAG: hypothetical protein D8H94_11470 [Cardiobacterium sp.]|nr:MAG: hypothetical protein D8H94_11470 [Cardiobacterium sp.]